MTGTVEGLALALVTALGIVAVGLGVAAAFAAPTVAGRLGPLGQRMAARSSVAAWLWAASALVALPVVVAHELGLALSATGPGVLSTYAWALIGSRTLLIAAAGAAAVAVLAGRRRRPTTMAVLSVVGLAALVAPAAAFPHVGRADHTLGLVAGGLVVAGLTVWAGVALACATVPGAGPSEPAEAARRYGVGLPWAGAVVVVGLVAGVVARLPGLGWVPDAPGGWLLVAAVGVAVVAWVAVLTGRARTPAGLGLGVALGVAAVALAAVAVPPYFPDATGAASVAEQLVGGTLPAAPTLARMLTPSPDALFGLGALAAAGLYLAGVLRLARRGDRWPVGRTVAWLAGLAVVVAVTCTGLASYGVVLFSAHMVQHMALSMLAPVLLVLGGPLTLALRALHPSPVRGQRGPREWLAGLTHSRVLAVLTHPLVVLALYLSGLFGLYFTPAFGWLMGSHLGHTVMLVHLLVTGYLYFWTIIGTDPLPHPVPYWGRFLELLVSMGVHAFFGIIVMMSSANLASDWFVRVAPPWEGSTLHDQFAAGGIAWAFGEIPAVFIVGALVLQWGRSEDRIAARTDRRAEVDGDADLVAYNAYLAGLADPRAVGATTSGKVAPSEPAR